MLSEAQSSMKFKEKITPITAGPLRASRIDILQVNLGYRCNMACKHCHVGAGPQRTEAMDRETAGKVIGVLGGQDIRTLDITGGAPELNPHFRSLVTEARRLGCHVIVRSNLSVFFEAGMEDLPGFFRGMGVEVIASLPYYMEANVDRVRGAGAFQKSIKALQELTRLGYGSDPTGLRLNLVYNPQGAYLSPPQETLEEQYRNELSQKFGISFNRLYAFTNMPLGRFRNFLVRTDHLERYMERLVAAFNPEVLSGVMCRHLVNVSWDGTLYDCDFNQALGLPITEEDHRTIGEFDASRLSKREIAVGDHCFACTAGQGST